MKKQIAPALILVLAVGCGWLNRNLHPEDQAERYRNAGYTVGADYAEGAEPGRLLDLIEDCAKVALWIGGATPEAEPDTTPHLTLAELDSSLIGDLADLVKESVLRFLAGQVVDKQAKVNAQQFFLGVATALKDSYQETYDGSANN